MKYQSRFGKYLTLIFGGVLILAIALSIAETDALGVAQTIVFAAWIWYGCYLLLWRPSVTISETDLILDNLLTKVTIPLGSIQRVDTKWALEVTTEDGRFVSFSAVAPGRHSTLTATRDDGTHLPESSYVAGSVRPGDLVTSDSGAVAYELRRRVEAEGLKTGQVMKSFNTKSLILWLLLTGAVLILLF